MMKKISISLCLLLLASAAFAGIEAVAGYDDDTAVYYQFTHDTHNNTDDWTKHTGSYTEVTNSQQNWLAACQIELTIGGPCDVWVSNYVNSWYWPKPLAPLDGNVYDMSATLYGANQLNGEKVWIGNGETTKVTYVDDATGVTNWTTAYFVGTFEGGEVISLWMTTLPTDGHETVDMQQLVQGKYIVDPNVEDESEREYGYANTTLMSRNIDTHDLAGNVRVNFGIDNGVYGDGVGIPREFVAFGVTDGKVHDHPSPSGQPLPGAMATCLLAMGAVAAAKKMKKRA